MSSQHGAGLGISQVGGGLPVDGQDEIADTETSVTANGAPVDYTADHHAQAILQGAHRHAFEVDENVTPEIITNNKKQTPQIKKVESASLIFIFI